MSDAELSELFAYLAAVPASDTGSLEYEQALRVGRARLSEASSDAVRAQGELALGQLYQSRRIGSPAENLEQARAHLTEAVRLGEAAGVSTMSAHHNLAVVYKQRLTGSKADNVERAIEHLQAALASTSPDADPAGWATSAGQLGNTYCHRLRGDVAENVERALDWYDKALALRPRTERPVQWAITKHNVGATRIARVLGDRRENLRAAIADLEEALEVRTEHELPGHFALTQGVLGTCHTLLGELEADPGHFDAAIACLEAAGRVWTMGGHRREWLDTELRLTAAHVLRGGPGDAEQAIAGAERVLLAASPSGDADHTMLAHQHLARALQRRGAPGDAERAVDELRLVLEGLRATGDVGRYAIECAALASAYAGLDRWEEAAGAFEQALDAEGDVSVAATTLTTQWARLRTVSGLHEDAAFAFARTERPWSDSLVALERGRTRALGDALERERSDLRGLDGMGAEARAAKAAFLEASRLAAVVAADELRRGAGQGLALDPALREQSARARAQLVEARDAIRAVPGFERFLAEPDAGTIAGAARPGRPVVYLFASEHGSYAVAVARESGPRPTVHAVPLRFRERDVRNVLFPNHKTGWPGLMLAASADEMPGAVLDAVLDYAGAALAAPLAGLLRELGVSAATLVPCGRLGALPLAAAPYDGSRRLLDDFAIRVAPSARVAVACAAAAAAPAARDGRGYVGVADPGAAGLPWAAGEVRATARDAGSPPPLVGAAATRRTVLDAVAHADVLHLACHGIFHFEAPERSRLMLADGDLAVADLVSGGALDGVRLVIASACETATSDVVRLPGEATGLATAFLQAGAAQALGTLWPVGDLPASLLVSRVAAACVDPARDPAAELAGAQAWLRDLTRAEALEATRVLVDAAGEDPTGALGDALAWLELGGDEAPFAEPVHWAPYVLFGG